MNRKKGSQFSPERYVKSIVTHCAKMCANKSLPSNNVLVTALTMSTILIQIKKIEQKFGIFSNIYKQEKHHGGYHYCVACGPEWCDEYNHNSYNHCSNYSWNHPGIIKTNKTSVHTQKTYFSTIPHFKITYGITIYLCTNIVSYVDENIIIS